jgi:hypothetical protein
VEERERSHSYGGRSVFGWARRNPGRGRAAVSRSLLGVSPARLMP